MINLIHWGLIPEAIGFYRSEYSFEYIEAPWLVGLEAMNVTVPPGRELYPVAEGYLVASAEQAFIHMGLNGLELNQRYVAAGPCFRDDVLDEWHQRYFFKVELIEIRDKPIDEASDIIAEMCYACKSFFGRYADNIEIVDTDIGKDITVNGIEVGSYGYRKYKNLHWVYGTGLAEPRFSMARNHV